MTYLYFIMCVCACVTVKLFFSCVGLHAVQLCGCVLSYVSMYCMHGKAVCITEITPFFHAKVTPQRLHFMAQTSNEINSYSE